MPNAGKYLAMWITPVSITVSIIHAYWAILLFIAPTVSQIPALARLSSLFFTNYEVAIVLLLASALSLYGVLRPERSASDHRRSLPFVLPQQFLLLLSAYGAIGAIVEGEYRYFDIVFGGVDADVPRVFIAADRAPLILLAIIHSACLLFWWRRPWN